jgi:hypothetical protein
LGGDNGRYSGLDFENKVHTFLYIKLCSWMPTSGYNKGYIR